MTKTETLVFRLVEKHLQLVQRWLGHGTSITFPVCAAQLPWPRSRAIGRWIIPTASRFSACDPFQLSFALSLSPLSAVQFLPNDTVNGYYSTLSCFTMILLFEYLVTWYPRATCFQRIHVGDPGFLHGMMKWKAFLPPSVLNRQRHLMLAQRSQ